MLRRANAKATASDDHLLFCLRGRDLRGEKESQLHPCDLVCQPPPDRRWTEQRVPEVRRHREPPEEEAEDRNNKNTPHLVQLLLQSRLHVVIHEACLDHFRLERIVSTLARGHNRICLV